eukprot:scaffold480_cov257-Pinguiococcus_pyrenoidosus.AAC.9
MQVRGLRAGRFTSRAMPRCRPRGGCGRSPGAARRGHLCGGPGRCDGDSLVSLRKCAGADARQDPCGSPCGLPRPQRGLRRAGPGRELGEAPVPRRDLLPAGMLTSARVL